MQSTDTTKYVIRAKIQADGVVERPDVVGAIFGQTEGLLGDDLDLRELQKTGRIGRIEVNIDSKVGKSSGKVCIPSSLDKVETAILAAALETIDRVGPCVARINVLKVEDVRSSKRQQIIDRAKFILTDMFDENVPESQEIAEEVRKAVRTEDITFFGKENLPAGPNVYDSDAILVVEGRADVLNLLRYGIKNAIAVEGTNVPKVIGEICSNKTVTAFTDGDRGGELIIKELLQMADIDYVARAPDGKGVEELTQKEIVKALRSKVPVEQVVEQFNKSGSPIQRRKTRSAKRKSLKKARVKQEKEAAEPAVVKPETKKQSVVESFDSQSDVIEDIAPVKAVPSETEKFKAHMDDLSGTLSARLLSADKKVLQEVAVRDIAKALKDSNGDVKSVVFDGVITQRILDIAAEKDLDYLVGVKRGNIAKCPVSVRIVTVDEM